MRVSLYQRFMWFVCVLVLTACAAQTPRVVVITATFPPPSEAVAEQNSQSDVLAPAGTPQPSAAAFPVGNPTPDPPRDVLISDVQQHIVAAGDTLYGIAQTYGVSLDALIAANTLENPDVLEIGQVIQLPGLPTRTTSAFKILPDNRMVRAPGARDFDIADFIARQAGYIRNATDEVATNLANGEEQKQILTASQIIERIALEYSVDPRLLLALLEHRAGWLSNPNLTPEQRTHPMISREASGTINREGLYRQLAWTANNLNFGYYGWKTRGWTTLEFADGERLLYAPGLNAGTIALQYFLSLNTSILSWEQQIGPDGFYQTYYAYFGDPFVNTVDPLVPINLQQPEFTFPFSPGETWFFTGGAHGGWGSGSAWAAVDFAPPDVPQAGVACFTSAFWVTAVAPGLIVRSDGGAVMVDLDGDGDESTGWTVLYLHIAADGRVPPGTVVQAGDRIGRASCEGGFSTATHMHIARRYNGEWIPADCDACGTQAPRPRLVFNGWSVVGFRNQEYQGYMERNGERRIAEQGRNTTENRVSW